MNKKLDEKLQIINKEKPILNDEDLMNALETIIDTEVAKSIEDMDTDLINSAVEFKLSLAGVNLEKIEADSEKHIEDYLSKIHETSIEDNKIKPKRKIAKPLKYIIAVAAVIAIMSLSAIASCLVLDFDFMDLKTFLGLKKDFEYSDNSHSLVVTENYKQYSSMEDFLKNENVDGLLLPQEDVSKISVKNSNETKQIIINFNLYETYLKIQCPNNNHFTNENTMQIGNRQVTVLENKDKIQGIWIHKENCYSLTTISLNHLIDTINNLKEY